MNAFAAAMAEEFALASAELRVARHRHDESAIANALDRLSDLSDILERVNDGLAVRNT